MAGHERGWCCRALAQVHHYNDTWITMLLGAGTLAIGLCRATPRGAGVFGRSGVTINWAHACTWLPCGMIHSIVPEMNGVVMLLMHHKSWESCSHCKPCLLVQAHIHGSCSLQMLDQEAHNAHSSRFSHAGMLQEPRADGRNLSGDPRGGPSACRSCRFVPMTSR